MIPLGGAVWSGLGLVGVASDAAFNVGNVALQDRIPAAA
jgi:hypothetical protein